MVYKKKGYKVLIVEGPDGGGKSTLIRQLQAELDFPIAPRVVSKNTRPALTDLKAWVDNNLEEGFQRMIFDRHRLISEPIYGPILRYNQEPGFNDMRWLGPRLDRFYSLEPIIIYCLPPWTEVFWNIEHDIENEAVREKIEAIYTAYIARAALDHAFAPGIVKIWDYTKSLTIDGKPSWFESIKEHINGRLAA